MKHLFERTVDGWEAWSRVFCDVEAFTPLVRAIYAQNGMPEPETVANLTPGTNAVFRCDDTVIKLFAPESSGIDSVHDFAVESAMLRYAAKVGIPTSELLRIGIMEDKYKFRYMILSFVEGVEAGEALAGYDVERKEHFARQIRALCEAMNQPCEDLLPPVDLKARALENFRLLTLPERLMRDIRARVKNLAWGRRDEVVVHGDITGENVLIRADGMPVLIDFADGVMGPAWYEWPSIIFELFHCDETLVRAFIGAEPLAVFVQQLMNAVALHDFGANIIADYAQRSGIPLEAIPTLDALGARLERIWSGLLA